MRPDAMYPLVSLSARRAFGVPLDGFASAAGIHPDLVRRYAALGLLAQVAVTAVAKEVDS
ncbi:hypothetical protein ACFWAN_17335 [Streptomyces mirabilis]|uniref:hypothetical protein n=1 Tax=Streptomyces mirabilis TaxID=68239 RepID=UPI003659CEB2